LWIGGGGGELVTLHCDPRQPKEQERNKMGWWILSRLLSRVRRVAAMDDACSWTSQRYFSRRAPRKKQVEDDLFDNSVKKEPRKLSEFNLYMKKMLPVMKQQHPELSHREVFKVRTFLWNRTRRMGTKSP